MIEEEDEGTGSDMTEGQAGTQWPYSQEAQPSGRRLLLLRPQASVSALLPKRPLAESLAPVHLGAPTNLILLPDPDRNLHLTTSRAPTTHRHYF